MFQAHRGVTWTKAVVLYLVDHMRRCSYTCRLMLLTVYTVHGETIAYISATVAICHDCTEYLHDQTTKHDAKSYKLA